MKEIQAKGPITCGKQSCIILGIQLTEQLKQYTSGVHQD